MAGLAGGLFAEETGATGLEPATSGVTGRRSNQLNYAPEPEHCTNNESPLLTNESLATFVGEKKLIFPAAATDMAGAAH